MFILLEQVPSSVLWHRRGCMWEFWRKTHCCSIQHVFDIICTEVIQERKLINTRNSNEFLKSYNLDIRMLNLDIGKNKKLVVYQANWQTMPICYVWGATELAEERWTGGTWWWCVKLSGPLVCSWTVLWLRDSCYTAGRLRDMSMWLVMRCKGRKTEPCSAVVSSIFCYCYSS